MNRVRQSYITRGLAIFFLLYASADLTTPHLCAEEMGLQPFPATGIVSRNLECLEGSAISEASADPGQEQSSAPAEAEEDCFCCCAHILPGLHFIVEGILSDPVISDTAIISLPTRPPDEHYRPPRFA